MMRWVLGCGIAAAVLVGGGTGGYLYAQRESEAAVERMFDPTFTAAGVSHKPGRYSLLSDRWELDDLTAETLPQQPKGLRIAHLSIAGLDPLGLRSALPGVGNAVPTMIATGIEVEAKPEVHADIERLEISGVDPRSALGAAAGLPVVASVGEMPASLTVTGLKITKADAAASIERIAVAGLELASVLRSDARPSADEIRSLLAGAKLQQAEIQGFDLQTQGRDAVHVTLRRLSIGGVAPGRIGAIAIEGISEEAAKINMSLASVSISDIAYRPRSETARARDRGRGLVLPEWLPGYRATSSSDVSISRIAGWTCPERPRSLSQACTGP